MTNRELRQTAREKAVAKGVTPILFLAYAPSILLNVYKNLEGLHETLRIHWAVWYVIQFALILFSYAGGARVSLGVWKTGKARVPDLFAYFAHGRLFFRALTVAALTTALTWVGGLALGWLFVRIPVVAVYLPAFLLVNIFLISLGYLYYALELGEGEPLWRVILSGMGKIARNLPRIVAMAVALWWWSLLGTAILFGLAFYNLPNGAAVAILVALLALVYWFLGPYFRLAAAGLAIEIFRGAGAAVGEPEEAPEELPMDPLERYRKRLEEEQ